MYSFAKKNSEPYIFAKLREENVKKKKILDTGVGLLSLE
jgi:hypothetical protein